MVSDERAREIAANMIDLIGDSDRALAALISTLVEREGDQAYSQVREALVLVGQGRVAMRVEIEDELPAARV